MPLLYVYLLTVAGVTISAIGAWFSVTGLAALFSASYWAVIFMAGSLEFGKLVIAAFLHRAWAKTNLVMKTYMVSALVVLSLITSMGIYGFLSNAYQLSSLDLNANQIKLTALDEDVARTKTEIARIHKMIDDIPVTRITRKINIQREWNPRIDELQKHLDSVTQQKREINLATLQTNSKVGPLIFIAKAFDIELDTVVKYLILVFVMVFDPLAICLIIATGNAMKWREEELGKSASLQSMSFKEMVRENFASEKNVGQPSTLSAAHARSEQVLKPEIPDEPSQQAVVNELKPEQSQQQLAEKIKTAESQQALEAAKQSAHLDQQDSFTPSTSLVTELKTKDDILHMTKPADDDALPEADNFEVSMSYDEEDESDVKKSS